MRWLCIRWRRGIARPEPDGGRILIVIRDIYIAIKNDDGIYYEPPARELGVSVVGGEAYLQRVTFDGEGKHNRTPDDEPLVVPAAALLRALQALVEDDEYSAAFLRNQQGEQPD